MNERQRMQYLDAMGIEMFVPRLILPGAPAPVQALLPVAEAPALETRAVVGSEALPVEPTPAASSVRSLGQVLETVPVQKSPPVAPPGAVKPRPNPEPTPSVAPTSQSAPAAKPASAISKEDEVARFHLCLWRVSDSMLVIDDHQVGSGLPTETLLSNILRFSGLASGRLPTADSLVWPMVELPGKPARWDDAREMVATYLEGKLLRSPVATILLFGEASFRAVAPVASLAQPFAELCYRGISIDAFAAEALVLPSLAEILHNPLRKRALWASFGSLNHNPETV